MMIGGKGFEKDDDTVAEEDDEKFDASAAKTAASKALIKAVKNSDVEGVNAALEAHYEACKTASEKDDY